MDVGFCAAHVCAEQGHRHALDGERRQVVVEGKLVEVVFGIIPESSRKVGEVVHVDDGGPPGIVQSLPRCQTVSGEIGIVQSLPRCRTVSGERGIVPEPEVS